VTAWPPLLALAVCAALAGAASASSRSGTDGVGRVAVPVAETNAAIEAIVVRCRRDFAIGVVTPKRRLRPDRDVAEEEALLDTLFDRAFATVDLERFALGVGGANDAQTFYLFAADRDGFLSALHGGQSLSLAFDIVPETAKDGAGFETVASFAIDGLGEALAAAGPACRRP